MCAFIVKFSLHIRDNCRNRLVCASDAIWMDVLAEKIGLQKRNEMIGGTVAARISCATCFVPVSDARIGGYTI